MPSSAYAPAYPRGSGGPHAVQGPPVVHASGPAPYQLLIVGGAPIVPFASPARVLSLSDVFARDVASRSGHGADIETVFTGVGDVGRLGRALGPRRLSRIDALVLVVEEGLTRGSADSAARRLARLVDDLWSRMTPGASVTLAIAPSSSHRSGDSFAAAVYAHSAPLTRVVELIEPGPACDVFAQARVWGEAIGEVVAGSLIEPLVRFDPLDPIDEARRLSAVRGLGPLERLDEARFRRVVSLARDTFGARCASFAIVGDKRTAYIARRGITRASVARSESLCDLALRTYGGLIIANTRTDPRSAAHSSVRSGEIGFYAGHYVTSPNGQPVGVLCVFDPRPRTVSDEQCSLLRDLALEAARALDEPEWEAPSDRNRP